MTNQYLAVQAGALVLCVGFASGISHAQDAVMLQPNQGQIVDVAHIYYNLATGEKVITLNQDGQTAPADTGDSVSVWSTRGQAPDCAAGDMGTSFYFALDDPGTSSLSTAVTLLDFGDIEKDTVVDCVSIHWVTTHPDTDSNIGGIGDGVEELAGEWTIWDADNGREIDQSTRLPLISFLLTNLPGNVAGPGLISSYSANIDLVGGFSNTNLSFEIGDSDGDCQSAAFCNSDVDGMGTPVSQADRNSDGLPDSDLDGDGLFDFSWTVRFYQPGLGHDFDMDGDIGTPAPTDSDMIGLRFGVPSGLYELPGGGFGIDPSVPDAGTGAEDRAVLINEDGEYAAQISFGGFQCPTMDKPFIPAAIFDFQMWGPANPPCLADFNGDGVLDFFDVSMFLQDFNAGGDFNGDGETDFFDISAFLLAFNAGCP